MDKRKIFISKETYVPNYPVNMGSAADSSDPISNRRDTFNINRLSYEEYEKKMKNNSAERNGNPNKYLEKDKGGIQHEGATQVTIETRTNQKHTTLNDNQIPCVEFDPKLKHICKERKLNPDNHLEKDNNSILHKNISDITLEDKGDVEYIYANAINRKDADELECTSAKKTNFLRNTVLKFVSKAIPNPFKTVKNIKLSRTTDKMKKGFKCKSTEVLTKVEKRFSQIERCNKVSNEKGISRAKLEAFEDSRSEVINRENAKDLMVKKLEMQYKTSFQPYNILSTGSIQPITQSGLVTLSAPMTPFTTMNPSTPIAPFEPMTPSTLMTQSDAETRTQSSKIRSAEEVLEHFRSFMQYNRVSLNRIKSDDINKKDKKPFTESAIRSLEDPISTATESANQDMEDFIEFEMKSAVTEDSRKVMNEASASHLNNSATVVEPARKISRQRVVYNERIEHKRGWIIQQIKDREILLKFRIMEGKYSEDMETKMKCIEEAEDLQDELDSLFETLEDFEKMPKIPNRIKGYKEPTPKDLSKSAMKVGNNFEWPEKIKTFSSFFLYMFKSLSLGSQSEYIFHRIYPKKFLFAFEAYLESKISHDRESEMKELIVRNAISKLNLSLEECRAEVKCKIEHSEKMPLEGYQNYINDLQIAADENLDCLQILLPQVTSVILPLMSYLSQSRKKMVQIFQFLNRERSDVFSKSLDRNQAFFDEFCMRHFKEG